MKKRTSSIESTRERNRLHIAILHDDDEDSRGGEGRGVRSSLLSPTSLSPHIASFPPILLQLFPKYPITGDFASLSMDLSLSRAIVGSNYSLCISVCVCVCARVCELRSIIADAAAPHAPVIELPESIVDVDAAAAAIDWVLIAQSAIGLLCPTCSNIIGQQWRSCALSAAAA